MEITLTVVPAITVFIVQWLKGFAIDKQWLPPLVILCATIVTWVASPFVGMDTWNEIVLFGIVTGFESMGAYSGTKTVVEKIANKG